MQELLLVLNIAAYLAFGYLIMIGLVWLVTRDAPELWIYRDWALKPVLFLLTPFGMNLPPQNDRPEVREAFNRDGAEDSRPNAKVPSRFNSVRAAKEYLAGRIVAEAQREGAPLSDVERKMLYFSETGWTLPGILEVNAEFERDYDTDAYEEKIAGLVCALRERATDEEQASWDDAVIKLSEGDHYLLVLIGGADAEHAASPLMRKLEPWLPATRSGAKRPKGDFRRLILVALIGSLVLFIIAMVRAHLR